MVGFSGKESHLFGDIQRVSLQDRKAVPKLFEWVQYWVNHQPPTGKVDASMLPRGANDLSEWIEWNNETEHSIIKF